MTSNGSSPRFAPVINTIPNDQPVILLDARPAFEKLTGREQLYAHHLARASFYGGLIVLLQTSLESPSIFRLIHRINVAQPIEELRDACVGKEGITEVDFKAFMVFCSGVYANMGNYKGFGDTKIVPDLQPETFEVLMLFQCAQSCLITTRYTFSRPLSRLLRPGQTMFPAWKTYGPLPGNLYSVLVIEKSN